MQTMTRKLLHASLVLTLAASVSACQTTALTGPVPSEVILRNEVQMVRLPFIISAEEDGTATPSAYTLAGINVFLSSVNAGHADIILIDAPDGTAPTRIEAIADHVKKTGLIYGGTGTFGGAPANGTITLYVERYTVTPPTCGTWSAEQSVSDKNNPSKHHGCATVSNLGLMVANPRDLIAGENGGNSTAAAVSAIYAPTPQANSPTITMSLNGLPGVGTPAPAAPTPPRGNR